MGKPPVEMPPDHQANHIILIYNFHSPFFFGGVAFGHFRLFLPSCFELLCLISSSSLCLSASCFCVHVFLLWILLSYLKQSSRLVFKLTHFSGQWDFQASNLCSLLSFSLRRPNHTSVVIWAADLNYFACT